MLRELQLSLFPVVIDGQVHVLVGGQEDLELGLGTGASHLGHERGGVQAASWGRDLVIQQQVGRGDLVVHHEGLAFRSWDNRVSQGLRCPNSSFT